MKEFELTKEELQFLDEQKDSELMRVIEKRLKGLYYREAGAIANPSLTEPHEIFAQRGILQGVTKCVNYLRAFEFVQDKINAERLKNEAKRYVTKPVKPGG